MFTLVTGGSGSGKSAYAEECACASGCGKLYYVASMICYDDESRERVKRHRRMRRGKGFVTIERYTDLAGLSRERPDLAGQTVLVECLSNLTANEMFDGGDPARIVPAIRNLAARCSHLVMVTNDLFSDGMEYSPSVQEYLRCLAEINRQAAEMADCAVEVVYSIPVALKGELPCV